MTTLVVVNDVAAVTKLSNDRSYPMKTKPTHTTGPWRVLYSSNVFPSVHFDDSNIPIAVLYETTRHGERNRLANSAANAHLIAAAPELLEALELCKEAMISSDNEQRLQKLEAAFKAASEAISKAKGGAV
jgi:hypothetical protein